MFKKNFFDFSNFRGDIFGGVTAGIVALPLALAFGVSSGLGPSYGLYGAIFVCFFASLFGGTNTQISGPTAPMTALSMVIIAGILQLNDNDVEKALPLILCVFLLGGLIQIVLGILKIGSYIRYIPSPVVSGFMTAIGVIILVTQIIPAIGYYPTDDKEYVTQFNAQAQENILEKIVDQKVGERTLVLEDLKAAVKDSKNLNNLDFLIEKESISLASKDASGVLGAFKIMPRAFRNISWLEFLLALGTIVIIYGFKKITTKFPSTLVGLLVMSGIAYGFKLDYANIEKIPAGLPVFNSGIFTHFSITSLLPYVMSAVSLALLGTIDSLLTSVFADNMTKTRHRPNQELIGQGIGNSIAAVFGGLPGAGATIRTVVNIKSGGKTKISGMIAGLFLLIILLSLGPIASQIPAAVLAGILVTVGIDVMDYKGLKSIPNMPKNEVFILLLVLVVSSVYSLVYGVGLGLIFAALIFMKKMGDLGNEMTDVSEIKDFKNEIPFKDEELLSDNVSKQIYINHLYGPLFFGFANRFTELSNQLSGVKTIIIRFERVPYMDQSGVIALESALEDFKKSGCEVLLTGLSGQPRNLLEKSKLIPDHISEDKIFKDFEKCIFYLKRTLTDSKGDIS